MTSSTNTAGVTVTVHSAITGQPVPGGTWNTAEENVFSVINRAVAYPEVQRAPFADRLAAENLLREIGAGRYPFRGDIKDYRLTAHGISHFNVTDNVPATVEATPAPEVDPEDAKLDSELSGLYGNHTRQGNPRTPEAFQDGETPVYDSAKAAESGLTPEAQNYLDSLESTPAPVKSFVGKSAPEDFKPKGWRIRTVAAVYGVAGLVVGAVAGGIIF